MHRFVPNVISLDSELSQPLSKAIIIYEAAAFAGSSFEPVFLHLSLRLGFVANSILRGRDLVQSPFKPVKRIFGPPCSSGLFVEAEKHQNVISTVKSLVERLELSLGGMDAMALLCSRSGVSIPSTAVKR